MHLVLHPRPAGSHRRTAAVAVAAALAFLLLSLAAVPASAKSSFMSRASGSAADTYWTQIDGTAPGTTPLGNVHIGWLYAFETTKGKADVFGGIEDWDCEEGDLPGGGGHGIAESDEEPSEPACEWKGFRSIESYNVPFTVDRKLTQARLTGTLTVYGGGHGEGGVVGRPSADIIWTGDGGVSSDKYTYRYKDDGVMETSTWQSTSRSATMSGVLGPMGFDPELSGGFISNFKSRDMQRIK